MTPKGLAKLSRLAALRADLAAAQLYRVKQALAQIEAEARALSTDRTLAGPAEGDFDPYLLQLAAKQDQREVQERARLARDFQARQSTLGPTHQAAARARGQLQMLEDMLAKARKQQQQDADRRAEAPPTSVSDGFKTP